MASLGVMAGSHLYDRVQKPGGTGELEPTYLDRGVR